MSRKITEFRKRLEELDREELLDLLRSQDLELVKQVNRIEWVFANKLTHLTWPDGSPVEERPVTNAELALLIDPPFSPDKDLTDMGLTIEQQRQIHIASDPVLWIKHFLEASPRVYQILMLRHPSIRKVLRAGRRLGKTWTMAAMILHYAYTHKNGRILVMAPMKPQVGLIYEEVMKLAKNSDAVLDSIPRSVTSPQYEIHFSNGSTVRFFTTGLRSGGKSDVARGQEAHLIILDELDYMGPDDLDALYAMLQKTDEHQPDKILVGASTPTGRRERFWEWSRSPRFKEFWFPSYANPHFDKVIEEEMRAQYNEMAYRHEIEADWGEDVEGVYPRRYVDAAFVSPGWKYIEGRTSARSEHLIGVDWDKYGAGPNIVVLEICHENYEDDRFAGKLRLAYREEIPRNEYVLTQAVERIIELNAIFNPKFIYVDRGYGDCVDPDTLITARHGMVPIRDIDIGHEVLSHDGDWHKVTGKVVREDGKDTFEVKVAKSLPVRVSDTHPFLCLAHDGTTEWKNVTEMKVGDYVALPKLNITPPENTIIDIAQYMMLADDEYDDEYVWSNNSNGNRIPVKRFVDLMSDDFLRFAGWYLSEGSSSGVQVEISQVASFDSLALFNSIERIAGIKPSECVRVDSRKSQYQDIRRIWVTSKIFSDFVGKLLGKGSANKNIPDEMMAYPHLLGPLLNGVFLGDGHMYKTHSNYGYELALTSFKLVDQIKLILNSLDISVSSHLVKKRNERHADQFKLVFSGCPEDTARFIAYTGLEIPNPERVSRRSWKSDTDYIFLPVRKINYIGKQSGLIDIEVEGAQSFVGNGLLLHNTQVELLAKYGVEHPQSGIKKKLRGISFAQMIEMKDPATKQTIKKEMKPFMVDNLRTLLENGEIVFPEEDEELYLQLISYVVVRTTTAGRPVFEASGSQVDHAHDALILAALAYTQNYGDLMRVNLARRARSISNELLLPMFEPPQNVDVKEETDSTPIRRVRSGTATRRRTSRQRAFQRKTF